MVGRIELSSSEAKSVEMDPFSESVAMASHHPMTASDSRSAIGRMVPGGREGKRAVAGALFLYVCIQQPPVVPAIKVRDKRDWFDKRPPKGVDTLGIGILVSAGSHGMSQFAANRFLAPLRLN